MKKILLLAMILTGVVAISCSPQPIRRYKRYVVARAPGDLSCAAKTTSFIKLSEDKYAARGCGAYAIYRVKCDEVQQCKAYMVQVPRPDNGKIVDDTGRKSRKKVRREVAVKESDNTTTENETPPEMPIEKPVKPRPKPTVQPKPKPQPKVDPMKEVVKDEPDLTPEDD
ncbi:MAG: hypothetical protein JXR95_01095 [Deltaproteobacteria bacterium]|nr:hypothetical protein [Deltaproteobacteria bacterium]